MLDRGTFEKMFEAAFLLLAVLFWSVALLHRQRELKVVGAVGLLAAAAPIIAIVVGHIAGLGAALGVSSLLSATQGATPTDTSFVTMVERIFGLWGYVAAWLLWRGHIVNPADQAPNSKMNADGFAAGYPNRYAIYAPLVDSLDVVCFRGVWFVFGH